MKKIIIWLLLLVTSFTADAQLIGGGPRKPKGSSTADLSGYAVKAANNLFSGSNTFAGQLATQDIVPDANNLRNIGSTSNRYSIVYTSNVLNNGNLVLGNNTNSNIYFRQGASGNYVGGLFSTTGNLFLQSPGVAPSDNGYRFQNYGTSYMGGDVQVAGNIAPDGNLTRDLGGSTLRYSNVYATTWNGNNSTMSIATGSSSALYFRMAPTGASVFAGFFGSSNRFFLQPPGATPTDNNVDQLQVTGSGTFSGGLTVGSHILATNGLSYNIGSASAAFSSAFIRGVILGNVNGSFSLMQTNTSNMVFRMHPTTGNITIQPPGSAPTDRGYTLDILGNTATSSITTTGSGTAISPEANGVGNVGHPNFRFNAGYVNVVYSNNGTLVGGTSGLETTAALEVRSTARGFLPPRMTAAQRTAISSPAVGLIVYQTDSPEGVFVNTSTGWKQLAFVP